MFCNWTNPICLALTLVLLSGCQRGETLGKVTGRVTLDGVPVSAGVVLFSNHEKGIHITSQLRSDGTYELQTAGGFGLPLGTYRVAVNPPMSGPQMPGMPPVPQTASVSIPPQYLQPAESGLVATVGKGENVFDVEMHSP